MQTGTSYPVVIVHKIIHDVEVLFVQAFKIVPGYVTIPVNICPFES